MFNSILNIRRKKNTLPQIDFFNYHFWIVEKVRKIKILSFLEHLSRYLKWKLFFQRYELVFFIDPNQYYLLPYLNKNQKLVYLLRDPSILLDMNNFKKERPIIGRADMILGISKNLCGYYFEKYYGFIPDNVRLWSNTVDMDLWNYDRWKKSIKHKSRPLIGLAGNVDYVIDIELLLFVVKKLPEYDFEIAGKLDLDLNEQILWDQLIALPNMRYRGFIPYNDFPQILINWDIGLVAAKPNHEYARYLNNNKQYQYMALGKPFVSYRLNSDYEIFEDLVFIANDKIDFVEKIKLAIKKASDDNIIVKGIRIASGQSSEARARQFLEIANNI